MTSLCVRAAGAASAGEAEIVAASIGAGESNPDTRADGAAIVAVVADAGPDAVRDVETLSERGTRRVLVVAVPGTRLSPSGAWRLIHAGAADAWTWDDVDDPGRAVRDRIARWATIDAVVDSPLVKDNLIGRGRAWRIFLCRVVEAALFSTAPVLVTGETGTGKEMAARLIHTLGRSAREELVVVDCTTIVSDLAGSELFGHERGAYTGADKARDGAFALADGGTLFLDEVGELPPPLQSQLLRAVQEQTYKRVGGNTWQRTSFRLVCATNRDLLAEVELGRFRRDLYYRIAGVSCRTPPLRERPEDVVPLAERFACEALGRESGSVRLSDAVRLLIATRDYPGNVRDLRRLMHSIAQRHVGPGPLTVGDVPPEERPTEAAAGEPSHDPWDGPAFEMSVRRGLHAGIGLKDIGRAAEEIAIRISLEETGSVREAASRLAITERALQLRRAARRGRDATGAGNGHAGRTAGTDPVNASVGTP